METQASMGDQFLILVDQIIEDNLDNEHFSVEDLAQKAGLSRSMLHRKLIKLIGKSANDLITETRLVRARELLENDVATASEIAYRVGFNSPSYFNRVFKKHFKVSPGDIRKSAANNLYQSPTDNPENQISTRSKIFSLRIIVPVIILAAILVGGGLYFLSREKKPIERSIAILPFDNLSPDQENQYFADGIVEDLLNRLSRISELKVISRTSSEIFRDKGNKTVPEIAKILNVSYILEGSVQRDRNAVRINVQLIDTKNDKHIWANLYDRDVHQFFEIQTDIARHIATELSLLLTDQQEDDLEQSKTESLKAFEFYQMGHFYASRRWIDGYNKSIEYFERAIAEDPNYGMAYAGLSDTYHLLALQGWMDRKEGVDRSIKFAQRALDLDPGLAEAHAVLGDLNTYSDGNWGMAEKNLQQAIKLNPNYSTAYQYYSELLALTGRHDQARTHINKAVELDPFSFVIRYFSAMHYYYQGQLQNTLDEFKLCIDLVGYHPWIIEDEFKIYYQLGMEKEAIESFKRYGKHTNNFDPVIADSIYEKEGLEGLLHLITSTETFPLVASSGYTLLGEYNQALDILEEYYSGKTFGGRTLLDYEYIKLSNNPRFLNLLKQLGVQPFYVSEIGD